jgi:putative MATE family efflux protein
MPVKRSGERIAAFFSDREYFQELVRFAIPISLQSLVTNSLSMVGVLLIGQLGEVPVAAVGLANQIFFLLQLILFGIASGSAMFTAQLWGRRDEANIRRVLSLSLTFALSASLIFFLLATLAPEMVVGIYSKDPAVIDQGSLYLRVFAPGFLFFAITMSFGVVLRSTGDVKTPMVISIGALTLNMALSYVLIFGKLGAPALGVYGAALAAMISRVLEALVMLAIVYLRRPMVAVRLRDFMSLDLAFAGRVFGPMLPVILNETFWAFGITAYFVVYGRMGTASIAAMNIVSTIDNVALVLVFGIANATAIMVGNRIGAGETQRAYWFAGRSLVLAMLFGILIGSQVLLWSPAILSLYKVSPEVIENARRVLMVVAFFQWIRAYNATMVVGVLRSGGDTRFSFFLDGIIIWVVGVPSAIIGAFVLHLPVYVVYFMVMSEEFLKWVLGLRRFFSRKWIHDMAGRVESSEEEAISS